MIAGGREQIHTPDLQDREPASFRTRETADLLLALIFRLLKPGGRVAVLQPDGALFGEGIKTRLRRFVPDLALRRKLVEQDPGDEPVSCCWNESWKRRRGW